MKHNIAIHYRKWIKNGHGGLQEVIDYRVSVNGNLILWFYMSNYGSETAANANTFAHKLKEALGEDYAMVSYEGEAKG